MDILFITAVVVIVEKTKYKTMGLVVIVGGEMFLQHGSGIGKNNSLKTPNFGLTKSA